ncbi:MAG: hypothetical protein NTW98_01260 [Candidatus Nomurabacteria bacterium]|nr:hypothetical protein [Candidatus Nomurabacteria bacterium]
MRILTVIPLQKNSFKEELTYFSANDISIGSVVNVPIRNKNTLALVVASMDASTAKSEVKGMNFNLKKITEAKSVSIFRPEFIEAAILTSKYFVANKSSVISHLIPKIIRDQYDLISKAYSTQESKNINTASTQIEKLLFQAPQEERISQYKTLIRESFANKKSVFITLPTEQDIKKFETALKKGIENFTIVLYSSLSSKKTISSIEKILKEEHPILIIGTPPFLSVPRKDLNTVILENENSSSYKTIAGSPFDLRTFVELFASKINAKLILADSLLRFETIARKELDNFSELRPMSFRVSFDGEIKILEKNPKKELVQGAESESNQKFKIISDESIIEIQESLAKNKNVFIFSLRKGLATCTVCKNCANEVTCDNCLAPVVLYVSRDGQKRMFACNKCKTEKDPDMTCTHCGSWDLVSLGIGTDTVYEEIKRQFPKNKIFKLDKEIAKNAKEAYKIITEFEENNGAILVGTEMALFYLQNNVALSLVASFDSLWSIPNYKISEKIIQIIFKLLEKTDNTLIIETKNIGDESLNSIKNGNILAFVREELDERKKLGYPPYKRFIKINCLSEKEETQKIRGILAQIFEKYNPNIFGGFNVQSKGRYTTNTLIKLEPTDWSLSELSQHGKINEILANKLNSLPNQFSIQIDPEDLL